MAAAVIVMVITAVIAVLRNLITDILMIRIIIIMRISFLIIAVRKKILSPLNLIKKLFLKNIIRPILINIIKSYFIRRPTLRIFLPNILKFYIFIFT